MDNSWPENPNCYVTAAQVARRLGYQSVKTFYAARDMLRERGFPDRALPRRWRASQIERWETWNAEAASAGQKPQRPANDAPAPRQPVKPASPTISPARRALAEMQKRSAADIRTGETTSWRARS